MKKAALFLFIVLSVVPSLVIAADELYVTLSSKEVIGYSGQTAYVDAIINNNQNIQDSFSITTFPPYWGGVTTTSDKFFTTIAAKSTDKVRVYFNLPIDVEERTLSFNVTVKSATNPEVVNSQMVNLRMVRTVPIYVSDIKIDDYFLNPEETVNIEISVYNSGDSPYLQANLRTYIKKDDQIVKRFDAALDTLPAKTMEKVQYSYMFEKFDEPGKYTIECELIDSSNRLVSSKSTSVSLKAVPKVTQNRTVSYSVLIQTVTVNVKNEGNVQSQDFFIVESAPNYLKSFFYPIGTYTEEVSNDRIMFYWYIPPLMPGEELVVRYEINIAYAWLVAIIVGACIYVVLKYMHRPIIAKRHRTIGPITSGKEIIVALDVKNRSRHEIRNVAIRDKVPPIARVVQKFDTLKPMLNATQDGTEIMWEFGSMRPKEERILTYRIKPVVDMAALKLPQATLSYLDRKKVRKTNLSKSVLIKP